MGNLIKSLFWIKKLESTTAESEIKGNWNSVRRSIICNRIRKVAIVSSSVCAAVVSLAVIVWFSIPKDNNSESLCDFASIAVEQVSSDTDIVLSVPGKPEFVIQSQDVSIRQSTDGTIVMDSNNDSRVIVDTEKEKEDVKAGFNQLVVPKGKRSHLTLADGTRIWMNSGSRLVYPSVFADKREVFVDGEAYFEVAKNEASPFTVFTHDCSIVVTGTSFNVSAYGFESDVSVVLVQGSVNVKKSEESVKLEPGDMVKVSGEKIYEQGKVEVWNHISWVHNILVYEDDSLETVFSRLGLCYGCEFVIGPGVSSITVSGKLYMKDNLQDVLQSISYSVPVRYEERNGAIYVYRNDSEEGKSFIR